MTEANPLMWAQEYGSIQPVGRSIINATKTFSSLCGGRSAASQSHAWDIMVSHPVSATMDQQARPIQVPGISPTELLAFHYLAPGMSGCLGTLSKQSKALLSRHIYWIYRQLETLYQNARTRALRRELGRAGVANAIAWFGWPRSRELFSLNWSDVDVTHPAYGGTHDLPTGIGVIGLDLLPQTKTNRTTTADLIIAFTT
jgi:hypothetical protein